MKKSNRIGRGGIALLALFVITLFALTLPAWAQHGGHMGDDGHMGHLGDDGHGSHGMMEHMGTMYSGEMMEQMSMMMDHMDQMLEQMHDYHEQMIDPPTGGMMMHDGQEMGAMMRLSNEMHSMEPYMQGMVTHLRTWMDQVRDQGDAGMSEQMDELATHMNTMMEAGRNVMHSLDSIAGGTPTGHAETDHAAMDR